MGRRAEANRVRRWQRGQERAAREGERLAHELREMERVAMLVHRFAGAMVPGYVRDAWRGGTVPRRREVL